jgi:hypothetical protein
MRLFGRPAEGTVWRLTDHFREDLSVPIWSADETDYFRVADDSGVERRFVPALELPGTLFLNGTGYQESKLES